MGMLIEKSKPYVAMICQQVGYAGTNIIVKACLNKGFSHFVLVVYRHVAATIALAPFAFFIERKERPKMTFFTFCQIFVLGSLGPVLDQNLYYIGLKLTSPTYACALSNLLPAMTFVMALIFRMERVNIKKLRSQAKIVGTIVCVGGAMLMTMYNGPIVKMPWSAHHHSHEKSSSGTSSDTAVDHRSWIVGSLVLIASTLAWSGVFILQAAVMKKYPAELSLSTLMCFLGTLQAAALGLAVTRKPSDWALGWDIKLLAAVYSGVVSSGIAYYLQGVCMRSKGPVFASAFSPLMMIIVAIMGSIILSENFFLGSVYGGVLIVIGLYAVLWGKAKDSKIPTDKNLSELLPEIHNKMEGIEAAPKEAHPYQSKAGVAAISVV